VNTANSGNSADPVESGMPGTSMRAILQQRYGTPDVLTCGKLTRPVPGEHEVLVRVFAAGVSIGDYHIVTGKPYVIRPSIGGLFRPRHEVPGSAMAGVVEAVGTRVTSLRVGDAVFGETTTGAFAEYVVVRADVLAPKPSNQTFEEAAAIPWAVTPLQALRDAGGVKPGDRVLINGASGGVGTWGVQIAKAFGAHVTAVCSTRNVARMRALGAEDVIDYTTSDFVAGGPRFDLMLDTVGNRSLRDCRRVLVPGGTLVSTSGGNSGTRWVMRTAAMLLISVVSATKLKPFIVSLNQKDLLVLRDLVESGEIKPTIEHRYPLANVADALRHVGQGHAQGQTVLQVASQSHTGGMAVG
jgi:NADPH:quinone reductase-like Zn-dependent oxidoreductase